jgi:hypothetical protein
MFEFPETRCLDCGTHSTGRICPACKYVIWTLGYHYLDPDDMPQFRLPSSGAFVAEDKPDGTAALFLVHDPDSIDRWFEPLYGGRPITPIGRGWQWRGPDEFLDDQEIRSKPSSPSGEESAESLKEAEAAILELLRQTGHRLKRDEICKKL